MISYHPDSLGAVVGKHYARGFLTVDTMDVRRLAVGICQYAWSGIVWKDGRRLKTTFLHSDFCVLDIDDTEHRYPLAQAIQDFADCIHLIGTTRNHQKDKSGSVCDRYRVVLPWSERIVERRVFEWSMKKIQANNDAIDASTLSAAQHFFPCSEIVSMSTDGYTQDVYTDMPDGRDVGPYDGVVGSKMLYYQMTGQLPGWLTSFLRTGHAPEGRRHYKSLGAAIELAEHGFSEDEILLELIRIPLTRKFRDGEAIGIARDAVTTVRRKLSEVKQGEVEQGSHIQSDREGHQPGGVSEGPDL